MAATFAELSAEIRAQVFPEDEADNLIRVHEIYLIDALIDLQKWVPRLQQDHKSLIEICSTYVNCGATLFEAPDRALIQKVYTVLACDFCSKVDYEPISRNEMDCLIANNNPSKLDVGSCTRCYEGDYVFLQYGDEYPDPYFVPHARACEGYVSLNRGQLRMFPSLLPTENIVIEWDGIRRVFVNSDTEVWFDDREVREAAEYFIRWKAKQFEDCDLQSAALAQNEYELKRRRLILDDRKENRIPKLPPCFSTWPSGCSPVQPTCCV